MCMYYNMYSDIIRVSLGVINSIMSYNSQKKEGKMTKMTIMKSLFKSFITSSPKMGK